MKQRTKISNCSNSLVNGFDKTFHLNVYKNKIKSSFVFLVKELQDKLQICYGFSPRLAFSAPGGSFWHGVWNLLVPHSKDSVVAHFISPKPLVFQGPRHTPHITLFTCWYTPYACTAHVPGEPYFSPPLSKFPPCLSHRSPNYPTRWPGSCSLEA